eukprot:TRINITY_DN8901_c0_g1_i1.p1 TRINITY_DN8901_c0_g1~~TRINITY_DN8901_c0_g1_i1.p1  ORF type:complete len:164 (+),score=4.64 TRINITY_DN8901_c0_g1_i1:112-603(+)
MFFQYLSSLLLFSSVIYYSYLWYNPKRWVSFVHPRDPSVAMSKISTALRIMQFTMALSVADFSAKYHPLVYFLCSLLVLFGQILNFRVYQLLGIDGVYYGGRFGKSLPWVSEWPYDSFRDPQYTGSILTHLGVSIWLPWHFTVCGVICYLIMMFVESQVPKEA